MSENIIVDKSFSFAIEIVSLYKYLIKDKKEYVLSKQLLRSGTSIGANVREGINGVSRADFKNKLAEAKESEYWIELMIATDILKEDEAKPIKNNCIELCRILSKIIKTCNGN